MSQDFSALGLSPALVQIVGELGYSEPTPIQARAIPALLKGRDVIGQSKTGSGKTAAFALPILETIELDLDLPRVLVLCPTRELCAQVTREFRTLGRAHAGLRCLALSGGSPIRPQIDALAHGAHIIVGTPGRVLDHLRRETLVLSRVSSLVLDEADRMLDMGFEADMEKILGSLPKKRLSAFFSATFPESIESLSRTHQREALRIQIEDPESASTGIDQRVVTLRSDEKLPTLLGLLNQQQPERALIFCNFKTSVASLYEALADAGVSVDRLHGDLEQYDRNLILSMFRNHSLRVVVATDVVARGIDIEELDLVVNHELPQNPDTYVHRIGRTGRAGESGLAVTIAGPRDGKKVAAIEDALGTTLRPLQVEPLEPDADSPGLAARMGTIQISGGRKDKLRPGDILGALTGESGALEGKDIGKIEILDRVSYVAVTKALAPAAAKSLDGGTIKARRFRARLVRPACESRRRPSRG